MEKNLSDPLQRSGQGPLGLGRGEKPSVSISGPPLTSVVDFEYFIFGTFSKIYYLL